MEFKKATSSKIILESQRKDIKVSIVLGIDPSIAIKITKITNIENT